MFRLQTFIDFHDRGDACEVAIDDVTDGHDKFEVLLIEVGDAGFQLAQGSAEVPAARRINISVLRITKKAK